MHPNVAVINPDTDAAMITRCFRPFDCLCCFAAARRGTGHESSYARSQLGRWCAVHNSTIAVRNTPHSVHSKRARAIWT
eukprot:7089126-Prymnesium_polylepis.2